MASTPEHGSVASAGRGRRRGVTGTTLFFMVVAAISALVLAVRDGGQALLAAMTAAGGLLLFIAPLIAVALLLGGYVNALLPHDRVAYWLGPGSGVRGYALAMVGGIVTPAGPFTVFPLIVGLQRAGAGFAVCVVYVTTWATLGLLRIVIWEFPFFGGDFVLLRYLASLPLPILAGLLAQLLVTRWRS